MEDDRELRIIPVREYADNFDQITKLDETDKAFLNRLDSLVQILTDAGQFTNEEANAYVSGFQSWDLRAGQRKYDYDFLELTIQKVAIWARGELKKLREFERLKRNNKIEKSPVLGLQSISRLQLSDIAFQGLSYCRDEPNEDLLMLIAELLDVDRHRKKIAEKFSSGFLLAAQILAQYPDVTNSDIAKMIEVNKSTIGRWRAMPEFNERIESYRKIFSGDMAKDLKEKAKEWKMKNKKT